MLQHTQAAREVSRGLLVVLTKICCAHPKGRAISSVNGAACCRNQNSNDNDA